MTTFVLLALLMVVIVLALLLPSFWRTPKIDTSDRTSQNISIIKEQLAMLEESLAAGDVTEEQYQQIREELEANLLQDTESETAQSDSNIMQVHGRWTAAMLALIVPIFIVAGYALLGTPKVFDKDQMLAQQAPPHGQGKQNAQSVEVMVAKLEERLNKNPDDAKGWFTLGRSYMTMGRYNDAARVLEKVYKLNGDHPAVLLSYADALTMARGGKMKGEPFELVKKALKLEPQNPTALWLAGIAYQEQGDDKSAISFWQQLPPLLVNNPESLSKIRSMIAQAKQRLGEPVEPVAEIKTTVASIKVSVKLAPELKARVNMNDTVFIFARAAQGPPMPLAVVRKQVKDLPLTLTLDDSMAMMPAMKLSSFPQVKISARISKSGQATAQQGDLQAKPFLVDVKTATSVELMIDQLVE